MSPASKSKSKDRKAGKEPQKALSKTSGPANAGSGIPASAYNPLSGTFHTLETAPTSSASPLHTNGRFRSIDETDDNLSGSLGAGVEDDAISNNSSLSGESEELKEKAANPAVRLETMPGADGDKRGKVRQKNERKHQRQKEKRAQELHERCSGYLVSRKLEALAQQLVSMGFSMERATMALILNEGKVEESVSWLFEGDDDADKQKDNDLTGSNLKIDISEELARIADMEIRYKCTKQEIERAVIAAEGDLDKAAESLSLLKRDPPTAPPKPEEIGGPPMARDGKISVVVSQNVVRLQMKPTPPSTMQQKIDDKDFYYAKAAVSVGESSDTGSKNLLPLKKIQPKCPKPQQTVLPMDKRWPNVASNHSVSSLPSPSQVSPLPAKTETRYVAVGSEYKNLQPGTVREPIFMMQRSQSVNITQFPAKVISSSPPDTPASWYPSNSVDIMKPNGMMPHNSSARSLSPNNMSPNQMFHQLHNQQQQHFVPVSSPGDFLGINRGNGLWNKTGASPTLAAASSLGLFSGLGSTGSSGASSPVDWSTTGSMAQLDYTSIDWSLDLGFSSARHSGLWLGSDSFKNVTQTYDSSNSGLNVQLPIRIAPVVNGVAFQGLQDGACNPEKSAAGSREWTSPFEGKDLFSLPREFVSSPTL